VKYETFKLFIYANALAHLAQYKIHTAKLAK